MVLKFVILAIIVIAFVGGGGFSVLADLGKRTKEDFLGDSNGSENKSTLKAEFDDKEIPPTPKEEKSDDNQTLIRRRFRTLPQPIIDRAEPLPFFPVIRKSKATRSRDRDIEDARRLDARRERSRGTRRFALKKSGAEIVREKRRQERRAFTFLRNQGFKFGGTGKFGRPKLFGNPNFDLGLPATATQADRERVIARQARKNAKRRLIALRNEQRKQIQSQFKGKSQAELIKIAESKGFKISGGLTAKQLAGILQRLEN